MVLACLWLSGCRAAPSVPAQSQTQTQQEFQGQRPAVEAPEEGPLYDLQRDETLGGHTLARHVGRTDEQLAERLRRETGISAASTYTDVATARRTVALALEQSRDRVEAWASRQGSRPNLTLHYAQHSGPPFGRSLFRGETAARPADRALVVLRWLDREGRWIVLTSYPETRR
jgi:toxin YxiD